MKKEKVVVILGQTATGKSALAIKISKKLAIKGIKSEIISADSRQIYKYLNIGTGKITKKEMHGVPHHLIDVANPKKKFTVVEYQKQAIYAMAEMVRNKIIPIICGGTGFYIDAITKGTIFPEVPPNQKLRKILENKTPIELFNMLMKLDKNRAIDIKNKNEINNKVRLIRAIEIAKTLGKVPKIENKETPFKFIKIGLRLSQDELKKKVEKRVKEMFNIKNKGGLLKEIQKLKKLGITKKRLVEFGFEYNEPTYDKVVDQTLKYAKRQNTYFKTDKEIKWFKVNDTQKIEKYILSKFL